MKLYTFDAAPNPARVALFMAYKGISLETVQIDLGKEEQLGDAYRALVPEATVPALVLENGAVLSAVIAIVHYLEEVFPDKPLLGRTPEERALILNWNHRLFGEVFSAIADTFRNAHPNYVDRALPGPVNVAQLPELAERGRMRLTEGFSMLNNALASKTFLAGDHVSFADIDLMVAIDFAKWAARMTPDQSLEHLHRWRVDTKAALEG
ncbi:MAG: glutathione S-transferase family protein [Luminiphilus sp.]|nr:glutathione S-transferase family protein [Luminiphilus sp.]MBL6821965.1 glutathione S-transferase family protein [Luminiphilus sp.]